MPPRTCDTLLVSALASAPLRRLVASSLEIESGIGMGEGRQPCGPLQAIVCELGGFFKGKNFNV